MQVPRGMRPRVVLCSSLPLTASGKVGTPSFVQGGIPKKLWSGWNQNCLFFCFFEICWTSFLVNFLNTFDVWTQIMNIFTLRKEQIYSLKIWGWSPQIALFFRNLEITHEDVHRSSKEWLASIKHMSLMGKTGLANWPIEKWTCRFTIQIR